ncbi:hypothetical protein PAAG_05906 [Paracoccidioides lutzii Pb01]|uniref:Uncharacterized protein n=1 Tax=Paracoccidioides lutzii (strain ATCC MYA-826 / Pb01) TaxID=502779 RepID=C1H565_PARBA|nr:hypothetical protein PAAG_05906 [Paracoccidioides lutzii Pb01]EEH34859.2 hypothetical protein PAAG_05906 [Paracoccidioides lutzii Pb01]
MARFVRPWNILQTPLHLQQYGPGRGAYFGIGYIEFESGGLNAIQYAEHMRYATTLSDPSD